MSPISQVAQSVNPDLEAAKSKWHEFKNTAIHAGRVCYLIRATSYLHNVIHDGQPEEKREAISLQASVNLERAKLAWVDFNNIHSRSYQEGRLNKADEYLEYTFKKGKASEKREAQSLRVSMNLQRAKFALNDCEKKTSLLGRKVCLRKANFCLGYVWKNGTPTEQQRSVLYQTIVNLEQAKMEWDQFKSKTSVADQENCIRTTANHLGYVLLNGNRAIRQKAVELKSSINLARAHMLWAEFQTADDFDHRKYCLDDATWYLNSTVSYGTAEDREEADALRNRLDVMYGATLNETDV